MHNVWMGNNVIPDISLIAASSYNDYFHHIGGVPVFSSKTISGAGAPNLTNLFQVVGDVEIKAVYGQFTDVTNVVGGPTTCAWELSDAGGGTAPITALAGTDLSGVANSAFIFKRTAAADPLILLDATQCRYSEVVDAGVVRPFFGGLCKQKPATATYIRFRSTTLAANNFTINFCVIWASRYSGSSLVAV